MHAPLPGSSTLQISWSIEQLACIQCILQQNVSFPGQVSKDWLALQVTPVKSHGKHDRVAHSLASCHCLDASAKYLTLSVHLSSRLGPDAEACSSLICRSSTASSDLPSFKLCTNCRMVFIVDHFLHWYFHACQGEYCGCTRAHLLEWCQTVRYCA